jgi:hypothetical protein
MVIHFGHDDGERLPMLRSAGYEVRAAHTLNELWIALVQNEQVDAVLISEGDRWITECARSPGAGAQHCTIGSVPAIEWRSQ